MPAQNTKTVGTGFAVTGLLAGTLALFEANRGEVFSTQNGLVIVAWATIALVGFGICLKQPSKAFMTNVVHWGLIAFLGVYCIIGVVRIGPIAYGNVRGQVQSPNAGMKVGVEWLARHANRDDVVMAEFPTSVHFYTGLKARGFPKSGNRNLLVSSLDQTGATYLLVNYPKKDPFYHPTEIERLAILREERPQQLLLVRRFQSCEIYRVEPKRAQR
jgi:hypothetical protein